MSEYLLSVALGPVGDFIAAARRTRDLRAGSWLLSEISKAVALELTSVAGSELIFPYSESLHADLQPNSEYAAANKILAVLKAKDDGEVKAVVARLRRAALDRLRAVASQATKEAKRLALKPDALDEVRMDGQLKQFMEFYAAWSPYDENQHSGSRDEVEKWAAARKTLRDFQPHEGAAKKPKSSLDGIRETVVDRGGWREKQFFVKSSEQLDGMAVVKRFCGNRKKFHFESTLDVAAGPYVARLEKQKARELEEYRQYLGRHEDRLPFSYGYLYRQEEDGDAELADLIAKAKFPEPAPPYYAFFVGDGDGAGDTIGKLKTKSAHKDFSNCISGFSRQVHKIAPDSWHIVFAGGDDVVAMLPLHEALGAAFRIRELFVTAMKRLPIEKKPTFSAGMVIAHATEPLTEVRRMAQDAERRAKKSPGKDSLAITVAPRSGPSTEVCDHWKEIGKLNEVVRLYQDREISPGFAYALRQVLDTTRRRGLVHLDETLFAQARELAIRKRGGTKFKGWLADAESRAAGMSPREQRQELQRVCDLLIVARPFARAMREAQL